jgi:EAL and modified HD-GYP domain-containing signal transduction protein
MLASEFFMARRPVVDRSQNLVAHELLFCNVVADGAACLTAIDDEQPASASVIADVYKYGLGRVIGELTGILYIDAAALMSEIFQFLPADKVMLEIAEMPAVTPQIEERLRELQGAGFRFALAVSEATRDIECLLPLIEVVRIDITRRERAELSRFCSAFRLRGKKLLAERVETLDQFGMCMELGFDFFQGYYFTEPHILAGKKLSPSQLSITELIALIASDAESVEIEQRIKADVALGLNLLRLVNTPAVSTHRIDSLRQALMVLGRNQLQRWLQIMLYAEPGSRGSAPMPLLALATTRGRLMELIAQKLKPGNRSIADTAFTVGIMSLMDTLFSMPIADILQQIPVVDDVADALLRRQGYFGQLLALVEHAEWRQKTDAGVPRAVRDLKLSSADLYLLQLAAFEWSDQVTRGLA